MEKTNRKFEEGDVVAFGEQTDDLAVAIFKSYDDDGGFEAWAAVASDGAFFEANNLKNFTCANIHDANCVECLLLYRAMVANHVKYSSFDHSILPLDDKEIPKNGHHFYFMDFDVWDKIYKVNEIFYYIEENHLDVFVFNNGFLLKEDAEKECERRNSIMQKREAEEQLKENKGLSTESTETALIAGEIKDDAPKSILEEALHIRSGYRNADYGDAVDNFKRIAQMAQLMTGHSLMPEDCVAVMMAVKLCREAYHHKRDNLVDLCGYADIMELVKDRPTTDVEAPEGWEPKDGDIVCSGYKQDGKECQWVAIYHKTPDAGVDLYSAYAIFYTKQFNGVEPLDLSGTYCDAQEYTRPATKAEKLALFQALDEKGLVWNGYSICRKS